MDLNNRVAIIGMAGRFPGASDLGEFWNLLRSGATGTTRFTKEELLHQGIDRSLLNDPNYVPVRGIIGGEDYFDAEFFGCNQLEAQLMDPQARVFLECAWHALEDAGYGAKRERGSISLYASVGRSEYEHYLLRHLDPQTLSAPFALDGTLADFVPLRTSHKLDLTGPSILVKTACSSSLAAVHLACQSILRGESATALVATSSISWPARAGRLANSGSITSKTGSCRAFDVSADGTVSSDAVAAIVLKRLDHALQANDHIYAVVRGSAINNDGASKSSFTAPSVDGQVAVARQALAAAGLTPGEVSYIEAHGSGTLIGDPIEIEALAEAYRQAADGGAHRIGVGAVKTNIGHTDAAAGLVGLIKVALCLHHGEFVPTVGFRMANPHLRLESTPFYVVDRRQPWQDARVAAVHSTGMGGTNVHCLLESAPARVTTSPVAGLHLLTISARTVSALESASEALRDRLVADPALPMADVAWTLQTGREAFQHRRCLVADSAGGAAELLTHRNWPAVRTAVAGERSRPVAFLCPGLGVHDLGLAAGLYEQLPVFRRSLDESFEQLQSIAPRDWLAVLRESATAQPAARRPFGDANDLALPTEVAHPLLFAIELALADAWQSIGIQPKVLLGYSLGEYVAATLSGVFSRRDGLALVAARARLIDARPAGAMIAVALARPALQALCEVDVEIAAENGAQLCVLAGPQEAVARQLERLRYARVLCQLLPVRHPFHTAALAPVAGELAAIVAKTPRRPPSIPFVSNVTGTWITDEQAQSPDYWARHLCQTIELRAGMARLLADQRLALLELGTSGYLGDLAKLHEPGQMRPVICSFESEQASAYGCWLDVAGYLWATGVSLDWSGLPRPAGVGRQPLPAYPFERRRYVVRPRLQTMAETGAALSADVDDPVSVPAVAKAPQHTAHAAIGDLRGEMRSIWAKAFGFDDISDNANFFEIGGHSLLAIQLLFYIRDTLGVELTTQDLKNHPTVAKLTRLVATKTGQSGTTASERGHLLQRLRLLTPGEQQAEIERYVAGLLGKVLHDSTGDVRGRNLHDLGLGDAIPDLMRLFKHDLGRPVFPHEIARQRSVAELCGLVARVLGFETGAAEDGGASAIVPAPREAVVTRRFRSRNRPIAFILSSARSGSTLLRVMLAGHPLLFCPPELHLLGYDTLQQRHEQLKSEHFGRGLQRALMELRRCDAVQAQHEVEMMTAAGATIKDVYAVLQDLAGPRLIVDKSPDYAADVGILRMADDLFSSSYFLVLTRHPQAVIESYVRNRIGAVAGRQWTNPYEQAEHHWRTYYQNILDFLDEDRRPAIFVCYEELASRPEQVMRQICASLGIEFNAAVLDPYRGARMIDGAGDPNFHEHDSIDPARIDAWRGGEGAIALQSQTCRLAERLGYTDI